MSTDLIAYLRVSTTMQSIERQRGDLADDCERLELAVAETFTDEGIGASLHTTKVRSDYEALLALIKSGRVDGRTVWLVEASRISRNMEDFGALRAECRRRGIRWFLSDYGRAFDLDNGKDRQTVTEAIMKGENESMQLSVRVQSGVRTTIKNRRPHGRIPFGYARVYEGKTIRQVAHPEFAAVVVELCERYASGESAHAIADDFQARGIPSPDDATKLARDPSHECTGRWHSPDISTRATSPTYLGKRMYEGKQDRLRGLHDGDWPALITAELHQRCVERLRVAKGKGYVPKVAKHLVSGIARCGRCAELDRPSYIGTRERNGRQVYACRQGCLILSEAEVDARVLERVEKILAGDEWHSVGEVDPDQMAAARERVALAQTELDTLRELWSADKVSDEAFTMKEPVRQAAVRDAEAALAELGTPSKLAALVDPTGTLTALEMFTERPIEIKRGVINALVSITLLPPGGGGRASREFREDRLEIKDLV